MNNIRNYGNIAFLSTYPPVECGIATFTEDLINAIEDLGIIQVKIIAVSDMENCSYDHKVIAEIRKNERNDYIEMANKLNASNIELLMIEHEYGIYGGEHGEFILDFIDHLEIPFATTLHTMLSEPNPKQKVIINSLGEKSKKIITMAQNTKHMLQSIYGIEAGKIEVIHHGIPKRPIEKREVLKKKYGYENKQIISTFGLLSPGKGIEHGIEAIAKVINTPNLNPSNTALNNELLYLILGQTHPALKEQGIRYRKKLEALVDSLNLTKHVKFVNKYLTKNEIIQYLQLSDIYMTPYLAKDQAVSGTLAYAVGYGKAIVSTPYLYAQELLSNGCGLLGEFGNPDSLADCIKQILYDPYIKLRLERNTVKIGRTMYWSKVASQYTKVLLSLITNTEKIGAVE